MKSQEIFDTVATHLFAQGARAVAAATPHICAYRGTSGSSCAVGCLIPDHLYSTDMEGGGITEDFIKKFSLPDYFTENRKLLLHLQAAHDSKGPWGSTEEMREKLEAIATRFNLDSTIVYDLSFEDR